MSDDTLSKEFDLSYSCLLHPDFSKYIRDGEFDSTNALDTHLSLADFLIQTAIAMTAQERIRTFPHPEDRLLVIEMNLKTYREAVEAAFVEINRLCQEFPIRDRRKEPGAGLHEDC